MSFTDKREVAYNWTNIIANAIKAADPSRICISGMHSVGLDSNAWQIKDQAYATDMLATHPYPGFVPHCAVVINNSDKEIEATVTNSAYTP